MSKRQQQLINALFLAITATTQAKMDECVGIAESLAVGMTPKAVEACKYAAQFAAIGGVVQFLEAVNFCAGVDLARLKADCGAPELTLIEVIRDCDALVDETLREMQIIKRLREVLKLTVGVIQGWEQATPGDIALVADTARAVLAETVNQQPQTKYKI